MYEQKSIINYLLGPAVRLVVELLEEEEKHDSVHADPPDERTRVVAVNEQQLKRVNHDRHKLCLCRHKQLIIVHEKPVAANMNPAADCQSEHNSNIRLAVHEFYHFKN